ncbi:GNAT family N-acetyltransferase [Floricoccus tropicus]|uniref:GNAT family N-acetyltransferase n=1 Tax=Floricoccus tropicus TaxID=1859473 RepID=A0A1E8GKL5_9LACT|nr:GNAT family N-acetyltransferase [Floricoccus tropicus]OFI48792.1 GNAT family N-acetyltransferase [Floricoccus tropicus]
MEIRSYSDTDEKEWVYTKALSYLFSPFFDDMETSKTRFNPEIYKDSIELVAVIDGQIVGILDIGIYNEDASRNYMYYQGDSVAYFTNLAVHPDFQKKGIAKKLFEVARNKLIEKNVEALSIFTRKSDATLELYKKWGAKLICKDYLVVGRPKNQSSVRFQFDKENKKLNLFNIQGEQKASLLNEGHYLITDEEELENYDIDELIEEYTYLLII